MGDASTLNATAADELAAERAYGAAVWRRFYEVREAQERALEEHLDFIVDLIAPLWGDGDSAGGTVLPIILERLYERYPQLAPVRDRQRPRRPVIPTQMRTATMERDAYRCVSCGSWEDLTCDHIAPVSKGGATTLENLQTLCRSCNSRKGAR